MGVADGDGQCIRCICPGDFDAGQLQTDHVVDLCLVRMTHTDDGLFHSVWGVFPDAKPCLRRNKHRNPPRLAKFQRPGPILVDEGLFNGSGVWCVLREDCGQRDMERQKTVAKAVTHPVANAICHMAQTRTGDVNDAPTHVSQPRIDPYDTHCGPCPCFC